MSKTAASRVRVVVHTYAGQHDGFRFGKVHLRGVGWRYFLLDRLNRTVRLWSAVRGKGPAMIERPDDDPERAALALRALEHVEPFP